MTITSTVAIDLVDRDRYPLAQVYAKQDDSLSRAIAASIYAAGVAWVPPSGATAVIRYRRPDGIGGIYDELPDGSVAYTIADNVITAYIAPDALSCPGRVLMDIVIVNGTEALATFDISVLVDAAPTSGVAPTNGYYKYKTLADINAALAARVQSVNNQAPDNKGNVQINAEQTGAVSRTAFDAAMTTVVRKVNGVTPDSDGNVNVSGGSGGNVLSVNSQTGAVQIPTPASGVCSIGADIPAKVVESVSPGASPVDGALVYVKFEAANTAGNPTLTFMGYTAPIVDGGGNAVALGALTAGTHGFQRRGETWVLLDGSGAAGEDGGYYAPSVDSGGNLTWTASKAGMPQVSGANIKGPKGVGIASIARTSGTGAAGTTDTYTITMTDGSTSTFTVYNGKDGASGSGTETTTHSIIWDLVNVTSSNNAVSVSDGASLVAVLTPADGYSLGDVTITMGGEVVTNVWDADTSTVTIPSVTGDVMISCAGVANGSGEVIDTTAVIEVEGKGINSAGRVYANENWGYTKFYEVNDANITLYGTNTEGVGGPTSNAIMTVYLDTDDGTTPFKVKGYTNPIGPINIGTEYVSTVPDGTTGLRATILLAEIDNYYCYETNTGKVIFAGKNTPYYGMEYAGSTIAEANETLSYDDDIAQNYAVSTASILGEDTADDPKTEYGISAELAAVIDEVRTAWMTEYGGDYRKIPLIITTDQHGRTNSGIFNMLGKTLSFHDVSKVMNLGDTVSVEWYDEDTTNPLVSCAQLEKWCESIKEIPFSKRLDVYGNHDTWYGNYDDDGNTIGTRYPANQSHLDQYFRNIYARRNNNNGWFVIRDDYFNVKYVVVSGFEYDGGVTFRIGTKQMQFIIDEFSKNDGYDIVVVSHVPLYYQPSTEVYPTGMTPSDAGSETISRVSNVDTDALFNGRKNKTSGSVTDSDGIEHTFDFSGCTTDILCGLHGHIHMDAYNYVGGNGLMSATFDWFDGSTIHFALVDRINRQMNIWKIEGDSLTYQNYQVPLEKPAE